MKKIILMCLLSVSALFSDTDQVCKNFDTLVVKGYARLLTDSANPEFRDLFLNPEGSFTCKKQSDFELGQSKFALRGYIEGFNDVLKRDCGVSGSMLQLSYRNRSIKFDITAFTKSYFDYVAQLLCNKDIERLKKLTIFLGRPTATDLDYFEKNKVEAKYIPVKDSIMYLNQFYTKDFRLSSKESSNNSFVDLRNPIQIGVLQVCQNNNSKNKYYGQNSKKLLDFLFYMSQHRFIKVNKIIDKVSLKPLKQYCSDNEELEDL